MIVPAKRTWLASCALHVENGSATRSVASHPTTIIVDDMSVQQRPLGTTGFTIAPLVLGGNVFGWTADETTSFDILDAFVDAGFNAIDTADSYSTWVPGHTGGESETIMGRWLARDPSKRDRVRILTKVGSGMPETGGKKTLAKQWIVQAVEASLRRLRVDVIDLYQAHWPDQSTPIDETLAAFQELLESGKVRAIGASNLNAEQLSDALRVADEDGLPRYQTLQPEYNLYDRASYDGALRDLCMREGLGVITYYSLASGFLTGKYRTQADLDRSPRGKGVARYMNERGMRILHALDEVSARHGTVPATIAIAWLMQRPGVTAPIASATSRQQLATLTHAAEIQLTPDDVAQLDRASA